MNASAVPAGLSAFVIVVLLVPVVRIVCRRRRLLDVPGPLKIHARPLPRLGGVAVALAISVATLFCSAQRARSSWHFFAALGLIWAVGLADDLRGSPALLRLGAQLAAGIILWCGGWRIPMLGSGVLSVASVSILVATFVNAFNFIDGADGIAAGVTAIIAVGYLVRTGAVSALAAAIAASLGGACLGFLIFNFPPATIFMGDGGSTVLGFSVAFLGLDFYRSNPAGGQLSLFPVVAAGLPLVDAALAVVRRTLMRRNPLQGDRLHSYDLLLARGLSPHRVALTCYAITVMLVVLGRWSMRWSAPSLYLLAACSFAALLLGELWLGALRGGEKCEVAGAGPGERRIAHF